MKGNVFTIDELSKANNEPKLTKDEAREWLNLRIRNMAKDRLRYFDKDKIPTFADVANCIYEDLVQDWTYNSRVLEACRAVKLDQAYIMDIIGPFFDEKGMPKEFPKSSKFDSSKAIEASPDVRSSYSPMAGMPYYASMMTLDEAHEELEKARGRGRPRTEEERKERHFKKFGTRKVPPRGTGHGRELEKARKKGAKDIRPRKRRGKGTTKGDVMTQYSSKRFEKRLEKQRSPEEKAAMKRLGELEPSFKTTKELEKWKQSPEGQKMMKEAKQIRRKMEFFPYIHTPKKW